MTEMKHSMFHIIILSSFSFKKLMYLRIIDDEYFEVIDTYSQI